jgi:hypothetical protein
VKTTTFLSTNVAITTTIKSTVVKRSTLEIRRVDREQYRKGLFFRVWGLLGAALAGGILDSFKDFI